jgi:hypothetical protein
MQHNGKTTRGEGKLSPHWWDDRDDLISSIEDDRAIGAIPMTRTYQIIKATSHNEYPIFESGSPSEVMSITKKLTKRSIRDDAHVSYRVEPPICPDCECPVLEGWCCQCCLPWIDIIGY